MHLRKHKIQEDNMEDNVMLRRRLSLSSKTSDIARKIDRRFFKDPQEAEKTWNGIEKILDDLFTTQDLGKTTKDVIQFLEGIWRHFSIGKYAKIFVDFARAEKALYGLGERYRDHLIHVFNVFVTGLIVFSKILERDSDKVFKLLKVCKESEKVPFPSTYNEWRRLYYLWCLMSTFHDIATPIEHRKEILEGLNRFLGYFRIETERSPLEFPFMIQFDASRYSNLMANMFANGIVINENDEMRTYKIPDQLTSSSLYFESTLSNAMNRHDHGVFGAYFLFKSIEEMFLCGKNRNPSYDLDLSALILEGRILHLPKNKLQWSDFFKELNLSDRELEALPRIYDLSKGETKFYNDYIFEQDVSRAALGIAIHNLDPDRQPKIFPIKFSKLPLSFFLILFDELQEFCRPEGLVLTEVVRFRKFPVIDTKVISPAQNKYHIQMALEFDLQKLEEEVEKQVLNKYNEWARSQKSIEAENYEELVRKTWANIFDRIQKRLAFGDDEPVEIRVRITIEGKGPKGKSLEFKSQNWNESKEMGATSYGYYG